MRRLALLALVALAAFPLSAHGRWARPRRVVVYEDSCRDTYRRWDGDRWNHRGSWVRRYDCDDERVILRPLPRPLVPPFQGRVELWIR